MKKFVILSLLIFISLPALAGYKPIPAEEKNNFKIEMIKTINSEIPNVKRNINNVVHSYYTETDESTKYTIKSIGIDTEIFNFYMKIIDIINKYIEIKQDLPHTDFYPIIDDLVTQYLKNNDISTKKIDKLIKFAEKKQNKLGSFP